MIEVCDIFESRQIRKGDGTRNGLDYYRGIGSLYPTDGSYLNPESDYQYRFRDMAHWIATLVPLGHIADIGGGTGNLGFWMKKSHPEINVTHVDFSFEALSFSKKMYPHTPIQSDARSLSFQNNFFDGILFADVLEHLKPNKAKDALREAIRVVREDGYLFINIPNRHTWTKKAFDEPSHIWIPTIQDMKLVLKALKLKNIEISTRGFPLISRMRRFQKKDLHLPLFGTSIFISAQKTS